MWKFKLIHEEVVPPLPECFMGVGIMSGWETLPLLSIVKPNPFAEILIEPAVDTVRGKSL